MARSWRILSVNAEPEPEVIQVLAIDHVVIRTADMDGMVRFYGDVLGCHEERRTDAETGLVQLRAGDALIDLVDVAGRLGRAGGEPPGQVGRNMDHFCLQIAPMDAQSIIDHLRGHGIEAGDFQQRYGAEGFGESIYIADPDGNVVELRCRGQGPAV